jgi:hypothetical protein
MKVSQNKKYMAKVAQLPCVACGAIGVHVHHIRVERIKDDFLTIPLCPECHTGPFSIHMSKVQFECVYGSELHLLAKTIKELNK